MFCQSKQNNYDLPIIRTSIGFTEDALMRTKTSLDPIAAGVWTSFIVMSSDVPYELICHAVIWGDHDRSLAGIVEHITTEYYILFNKIYLVKYLDKYICFDDEQYRKKKNNQHVPRAAYNWSVIGLSTVVDSYCHLIGHRIKM